MKKIISILVAVTMIFTMSAGCGKKEAASQVSEVEITLPASTGVKAMVEGEAVITTQIYLLARAYFDKLANYDTDSFDANEYKDLLSKAVEAFRIADAFSSSLERHAKALEEIEANADGEQEKSSYQQLSAVEYDNGYSPFEMVAYAAGKKSAAVRYAEELTRTFDNAKNGQKLKTIAEKYGTDVKKAKVMLDQAQAILEGAAYEDQAAFENKCYELAVETKSACSTTVFVLSCITSGGLTAAGGASVGGIVEAGGVAFNGVSAIIDLGTAATIHTTNGEGNEYTAAWEKTAEMVAPVATVFSIAGGIQNYKDFKDPTKVLDKYDNAAQACLTAVGIARDYIQDGTVLGVSANVIDGCRKLMAYSAEAGTKAAEEALIKSGVSEEALTAKSGDTASEQSQKGLGLDAYIEAMGDLADSSDPLDVEAIIETIDAAFVERAAEEGVEVAAVALEEIAEDGTYAEEIQTEEIQPEDEAAPEDEQEQPAASGSGLPITAVAGTYQLQSEYNTWMQTFEVVDDTHLKTYEDDPSVVNVGTYDASTGVLSYSDDQSEISFSVDVTFTDTGNGIRADMMVVLSDGEGGGMEVPSTGMKQ